MIKAHILAMVPKGFPSFGEDLRYRFFGQFDRRRFLRYRACSLTSAYRYVYRVLC